MSSTALKAIAKISSPPNVLPILTFHRVLEKLDRIRSDDMEASFFDDLIKTLSEVFDIIPLRLAIEQLRSNKLERGSLSITFDDGYRDNYDVAYPILRKYGACATFFISSGFIDGGWMWNDGVIEAISRTMKTQFDFDGIGLQSIPLLSVEQKRIAINRAINNLKYLQPDTRKAQVHRLLDELEVEMPNRAMMTSDHIVELLNGGMDVGGHTISHPILTTISDELAQQEIEGNKERLEQITGKRIELFAYPNGKPDKDFNNRHMAMVKNAGYMASVSTEWGIVTKRCHSYALPRLSPWDKRPGIYVARVLKELVRHNDLITKFIM